MKNIVVLTPRNPSRKRGRKKENKLLIECGRLMIDSGKMKDLTSYAFINLSERSSHLGTLQVLEVKGNKEILTIESKKRNLI